MRVAVAQFGVGADVDGNLAACLGALDDAARLRPDLVVLPEFCNHASWYEGQDHCYAVSLAVDGPFLQAVAAKTRALKAHVVINCTLRRDAGQCTGTSLLYGPDGTLLGASDKQVLIGHENDFLRPRPAAGADCRNALGTPRPVRLHGRRHLRDAPLLGFARRPGAVQQPQLLRRGRRLPACAGAGGGEQGVRRRRQQGRAADPGSHFGAGVPADRHSGALPDGGGGKPDRRARWRGAGQGVQGPGGGGACGHRR